MATDDQPHTTVIRTDEPVNVVVGDGTDARWFRMFTALVDSEIWANLSPSASKVYVVLAKHADREWLAWPSVTLLARLSGLERRSVFRAVQELQTQRLLVIQESGRGRGRNVYQLLIPRGDSRVTSEVTAVSPVRRQQCHIRGDSRVTHELDQKNKTSNSRHRLRSNAAEEPAAAGAEAGGADPEILDALAAAEIGEPARSRLAGLPGMSVALVERTVRKCQDKPTGILIRALEAAAEAAVVRRRRAAERRAQEGVGVPPAEEPVDIATGEDRQQGLAAMREALERRRG